ncbi:MAG: MFS transporter [Dehalococcoidia bacterium]
MRADLDLTYTQAGIVLAQLFLGGLLGTPFGGLAADFVDRRLLSAGGAFAYAAAMVAFGLAHDFWVMVVAAFFWGAASDPFVHPSFVVLAELDPDNLEVNTARQNLFSSFGDILSPLTIALVFAVGLDWRALVIGGGILMALYGFWFLSLTFPPVPPSKDGHTPWSSVVSVIRDKRVIRLALVLTLYSTLDEPFVAFVILFARETEGYGASVASLVGLSYIASGALGYTAVPWLLARYRGGALLQLLTLGLGAGVLAAAIAPHIAVVVVGLALAGTMGAAFYSILDARLALLRPGQVGAVTTVSSYIDTLALGFPPLVGAVADAASLQAGLFIYAAIPALMLVLLLLPAPSSPPPGLQAPKTQGPREPSPWQGEGQPQRG